MKRKISSGAEADFDASIVIATRDRSADLKVTLEHLARAEVPASWRVELLIVDNGSSDDTKAVALSAQLPKLETRYLYEGRRGKSYAYHTAMAAVRGKAMLFTDDDVHVPANWIEAMCGPILDGSADAVQGGVRIAPHLERPWLKGLLRVWVASVEDPVHRPPGLVGANMACGRKALAAAGPFDLRLGPGASGYFEDTAFGWAVERAGLRIAYLPHIAVEHNFDPDRLELQAFLGAAKRMAASRAIIDRDLNPTADGPSAIGLLGQLPGLGWRSLTQLARYAISREPDKGFIARYYFLKLWQASRRQDKNVTVRAPTASVPVTP
jgi:glycosyltransferase involved in cell wall biosynthesis